MRLTPIGEFVERVRSWNPTRDAPQTEIDYIDLGAVDNEQKIIGDTQKFLGKDAPSRARQKTQEGDILVSTVRPYLNGVARVPQHLDGATASTGFCVLRPAPERIDPSYLFHWIKTPAFVADMVRKSTGASYPAVSDRIVQELLIPLPPLAEQRRIAAILDQADELSRLSRQSLSLFDCLGQAIFYEMFGAWDSGGGHWNQIELGDALDFMTSGSRGWAEYYADTGANFIRIQNVKRGHFDWTDMAHVAPPENAEARRTRVKPGDVLMSITADLGRAAVVPPDIGDAYINQHLAIIRSSVFNPHFLAAALTCPSGQRAILKKDRSAVKSGVNFDDIRTLALIAPPRGMQDTFADRLAAAGQVTENLRTQRQSGDALFSSLQHRAFRGEL